MTDLAVVAPVVKSVHVTCSPEHAFEVFTREIGSWWPLETHALHPGATAGTARENYGGDGGWEMVLGRLVTRLA